MIEQYINDNEFDRTQLALDVKNGKISAGKLNTIIQQIDEAISSGNIQSPYIGNGYPNKRKKSEWNTRYVDYLVAEVSSSEVFNKESMIYLLKVAKYVKASAFRGFIKIVLSLVVIGVAFFAGLLTGKAGVEELKEETNSLNFELEQIKLEKQNLQNRNDELEKTVQEIKNLTEKVSTKVSEVPNNNPVEEDELNKFINRALSGENVKAEFQKTDYSSADVEKRALDRKLTRKDAEKLVANLANPQKFNVNKFGE